MIRLWIDDDTVKKHTNEDGDLIIRTEDIYFFKRQDIAHEEGYHLEFNTAMDGGFELYLPYDDMKKLYNTIGKRLLQYAQGNHYETD